MDARTTANAPTPEPSTPVAPAAEAPAPKRRLFNVSPLNQRRWENFKRNRRGYWAMWLFMVLFLSLIHI